MTTTTKYREHQHVKHFVCTGCDDSGDICRLCHGSGYMPCLLQLECDGDFADVLSQHDEGIPACQTCEDRCVADAAEAKCEGWCNATGGLMAVQIGGSTFRVCSDCVDRMTEVDRRNAAREAYECAGDYAREMSKDRRSA